MIYRIYRAIIAVLTFFKKIKHKPKIIFCHKTVSARVSKLICNRFLVLHFQGLLTCQLTLWSLKEEGASCLNISEITFHFSLYALNLTLPIGNKSELEIEQWNQQSNYYYRICETGITIVVYNTFKGTIIFGYIFTTQKYVSSPLIGHYTGILFLDSILSTVFIELIFAKHGDFTLYIDKSSTQF